MKLILLILLIGITEIFCNDTTDNNNQVQDSNEIVVNANDTTEGYKQEEQLNEDALLNQNITQVLYDQKLNSEWIVIQRRKDGDISFYRNWEEYKNGFGDLTGDFFIGLETIHQLTSYGAPQELLITLNDFEYNQRYALYDHFIIGGEDEKYIIKELGKYSGNAGESMSLYKYRTFSTYDQNNDGLGCARNRMAGWWYNTCYNSNLNGLYLQGAVSNDLGITWSSWRGTRYSLKSVEMRIRPKSL